MNPLGAILAFVFVVAVLVVYVRLDHAYRLIHRTGWRFSCAHCQKREFHSIRTFEAFESNKRKLFCAECHGGWLAAHPISAEEWRTVTALRWLGLVPFLIVGAVIAYVLRILG